MAKTGIDYFSLDVGFLRDKKIKLIKGEFGAKGVVVLLYLLCSIYEGDGYYKVWDEDDCYLTADAVGCGVTPELTNQVVQGCVRRDLFDKDLFDMFGVLTSQSIQKRYCRAAYKRDIEIFEEYLLLDLNNPNDITKATSNKVILKSLDTRNSSNNSRKANDNSRNKKQSKVKESKVKYINNNVQNDCTKKASITDVNRFFELIWKMYPNKKGKGQVSDSKKKALYEIGYETLSKCIDRYKTELENDKEWRKPQNGSTFFNSGYVDYLDENYEPSKSIHMHKDNNKFNQFPQREYSNQDYVDIERKLLNKGL